MQCDKYKDKSPKMPEIFFAATGFGFLGLSAAFRFFGAAVGIFLKSSAFVNFHSKAARKFCIILIE